MLVSRQQFVVIGDGDGDGVCFLCFQHFWFYFKWVSCKCFTGFKCNLVISVFQWVEGFFWGGGLTVVLKTEPEAIPGHEEREREERTKVGNAENSCKDLTTSHETVLTLDRCTCLASRYISTHAVWTYLCLGKIHGREDKRRDLSIGFFLTRSLINQSLLLSNLPHLNCRLNYLTHVVWRKMSTKKVENVGCGLCYRPTQSWLLLGRGCSRAKGQVWKTDEAKRIWRCAQDTSPATFIVVTYIFVLIFLPTYFGFYVFCSWLHFPPTPFPAFCGTEQGFSFSFLFFDIFFHPQTFSPPVAVWKIGCIFIFIVCILEFVRT